VPGAPPAIGRGAALEQQSAANRRPFFLRWAANEAPSLSEPSQLWSCVAQRLRRGTSATLTKSETASAGD